MCGLCSVEEVMEVIGCMCSSRVMNVFVCGIFMVLC